MQIKNIIDIRLIVLFISIYSCTVNASICAEDLDGSGAIDNQLEMANCQTTNQGDYCSVNSQACTTNEICPIDSSLTCTAGQCAKTGKCNVNVNPNTNELTYQCSTTGDIFDTSGQCNTACTETAQCVKEPPKCPLGDQYACMEVTTGEFRCSANSCVDQATLNETEITIDSSIPDNSGPRDESGLCLGEINFFAGRGMTCKKAGIKSNYHNCCNVADNDTISDSLGSDVEGLVIQQGVSTIATYASYAYSAYSTGLSAEASATYAWNQISSAAYIQFTVAVIVIQYLMTPQCSQMDMETSALKNSDMCHYVGTYCSTKWNFVGCVQKKKTYCCFNSVLAKLINEQGRLQLPPSAGWGTAESPNCSGFTPEQFQSLDFGLMDLSAYYDYISKDADQSINNNEPQQNTKDAVQTFYDNIN